jgi:hypothetical protein
MSKDHHLSLKVIARRLDNQISSIILVKGQPTSRNHGAKSLLSREANNIS